MATQKLTFEDYDSASIHYDDARRPVGLASFKKHLRASKYADCHKILDLGCGTGNYLQHLNLEAVEYIGLEQSEGMVSQCKSKIEKLGLENSKAVQGSAFEIPFPDEEFTAVITTQTVHHFGGEEKIQQVLKECARVLKKDGIMIINHSGVLQSSTCWWCRLLPSWDAFAKKNCVESEVLVNLGSAWFDHIATDMIKETLTRQDLFENPKYIISKDGQKTDSSWRAVPENEVKDAVAFVEKLLVEKKWEEWFEVILTDLDKYGQSNNVVLIKK